jgi:hypothetical protein
MTNTPLDFELGTTLDAEKVHDSALQTTDNCLEGKIPFLYLWMILNAEKVSSVFAICLEFLDCLKSLQIQDSFKVKKVGHCQNLI